MTSSINVSVFIGYQIKSEYHKSSEIKKFGSQLENFLQNHNIEIDLELGEFHPGKNVLKQIPKSIEESDVCILDISENNPNVLFESGYALGKNKKIILMKNKKSGEARAPTDLSGYIRSHYEDGALLNQVDEVGNAIVDFVNISHPIRFYLRSLWGLGEVDNTIIACSEIPHEDSLAQFEEYIEHRRYGDLDALISLRETIQRLYPGMSIRTTTAKSRNRLHDVLGSSNLIIVGGLDLNPLFADFERWSPFSYDYGESEEDIYLRDGRNDELLQFNFDEQTKRAKDHCFFMKRSLDGSNRRKLIIIGGAHAWGVLGAARMFEYKGEGEQQADLGYKNAKTIVRSHGSDPHFAVSKKVTGYKGGINRTPIQPDSARIEVISKSDRWEHASKRDEPKFDEFTKER